MTNIVSENWQEGVNTEKKSKNVYARLIQAYSKDKLKDKNIRSTYLQDILAAEKTGNVSADMIADINKFAQKDPDGYYDGLTISPNEISVGALKRESTWYFASIVNNRRAIKDLYLQEYDISDSDLWAYIDVELNLLSEKQLNDLLTNERNRKKFLEKQVWAAKLPNEKSIGNFLREMNLEKMYKRVNPDSEVHFYDLIQKIKSGNTIDYMDIEMLLTSGIYNQSEKQKFIAKLLPSISLAKAKQLNLIDTQHAAEIKDECIISVDPDLHKGAIREISASMSDEDIVISIDKFTWIKKNIDKIIDNPFIFNDFVERYNNNITNLRENIKWKEIKKGADFLSLLSEYPIVHWVENFKKGSVIEISQKQNMDDWSSKQVKLYWKIIEVWDDGSFSYIDKWQDKYDAKQATIKKLNYNDFLEYITQGNPQAWISLNNISLFTESQFDGMLSSWKISEYNWDTLRLTSKDQIQADIQNMSRDINETQEALRAKEVQMRNDLSKQRKPKLTKSEIQEKIDTDPWIQKYRTDLERIKQEQYEKTESLDNLESNHYETLKAKINEIDKEWDKYGLEAGTTFKTKAGDIYTITHNPSKAAGEIHITSLAGPESYSFEDFFRWFKQQETKRVNKQSNDFAWLVDIIKTDWWEDSWWNKFSFKDGKIKKDDSQKNIVYDYLGSKSSEELIKIHDISWDRVTISFWKLHSKGKRNKDGELIKWADKKSIKDETFSIENREYVVTLWFLEEYIKQYKLNPRWLQDNQEVVADEKWIGPMKKNVHFWSLFFHNRATIADAVKWWKLFFDQMKEAFEMGSDEKANQFALKYMWAVLTEDMKRDMQSRLEQKQKKSMDDYLERLRWVASDVAIKMIDKWLHDKYAPDYLHEAAVVFMLEKYWVLNAKWLQKYEWKYIWYQALGWEPNDAFFKKIKEEKESQSLPFTEELLVYLFLKEQCRPNWFKGKKRRSKLHKEVKKHRATGKDEEYETGKRDGNDERTIEGRVNGGVEEMLWNNYPNMVWWLEVAVNKWWPMHLMNKIPFLAAFSGVAYNFEEKTTDQLKNFPGGTRLLMMLRFFSFHKDLDLLNKTILGISHTLERRGDPKHVGMWKQAQVLYDQLRSPGWWVAKKIKKAEAFYDQYGEELTNILYMLNTWNIDDTTNKLIFFEKDNTENEFSETFTKYYNTLHDFVDADTSFEDEWLMSDPFKWAGTSGIEMHKFAEQQIGTRQGQFKKHTSWPIWWSEIQHELEAIPKRQYDPDPVKNREMQLKLLSDNLQRFISGIMLSVGTNARELWWYNAEIWPFNKLNKWWIDMTRFNETSDFSVHGLLHAKWDVKRLVDEFSNQIIQSETIWTDFTHLIINEMWPNAKWWKNSTSMDIENSVNSTRQKVSHTTDWSSSLNPYDFL